MEGGVAPRVLDLVERVEGAPDFFRHTNGVIDIT